MCPYSDLEYMILIEDDSQKEYFIKLASLIEMQIASLGETPATNLLVFTTLGSQHTSGFHVDTGGNPRLDTSLIGTPHALAALQRQVSTYELESPIHTLLTSESLEASETSLFKQYQDELTILLAEEQHNELPSTKREYRGFHLLQLDGHLLDLAGELERHLVILRDWRAFIRRSGRRAAPASSPHDSLPPSRTRLS